MQCMSKAVDPKECDAIREDYLECLHNGKEVREILIYLRLSHFPENEKQHDRSGVQQEGQG